MSGHNHSLSSEGEAGGGGHSVAMRKRVYEREGEKSSKGLDGRIRLESFRQVVG